MCLWSLESSNTIVYAVEDTVESYVGIVVAAV